MGNYQGFSLDRELINIIDESIKGQGYSSRADFVRQAIRNELKGIRGKKK